MKRRLVVMVAVISLVVCGPALAHHGAPALYDILHPIDVKGTVTEFVWRNPHAQIYMDVKDANGKVVHWSVETNAPGGLTRAGWTRNTLEAGDVITVTLCPAKSGAPVGFSGYALGGGKIVLANTTPLVRAEPDGHASRP